MIESVKSTLKVANLIQNAARDLGFGRKKDSLAQQTVYSQVLTDPELIDTTNDLFAQGHYALAVEEAFKYLNNLVKRQSGLNADGANLMRTTFSLNDPLLKINSLRNQSEKDQQQGYMDIFAGCMIGIRNPRAHEHKYLDEPQTALALLALANHLTNLVKTAKKLRKQRKSTKK